MNNLYNISYIKKLLRKYNFNFSKKLGQNFLINKEVCPAMVNACLNKNKNIGVIEIGPGIGTLTYELALNAKKVVAIELDKRLLPILNETLKDFDNIKILNDDILKIDLKNLIKNEFDDLDVVVCANLPYCVTSPTIMKLLEENLPIKNITVMIQKEAAMRICAAPAHKLCGAISYAVSYYSEPSFLFDVLKTSFLPEPKVDSAVINLKILKKPCVNVLNEKLFFNIIKSGFCKRRKTLKNSLLSCSIINKDNISTILNECNIPYNMRAEQLTLAQFADICNFVYKNYF